jgi:hypothetical protein
MISFKPLLPTPKRQPIKNLIEDWESAGLMLKWTGGDLNPRPPECKSGVHTS